MNLVDLIKEDEGLRLKPYRCTAGKLSVGYGRNLEDVGISESEAQFLLFNDVNQCLDQLRLRIDYFGQLSEVRQAVLINMAFNLGTNGLLGFKRMFTALEAKRYLAASLEMEDSKWAKQVPNRARRLAWMMLHDKWPQGTEYLEGV